LFVCDNANVHCYSYEEFAPGVDPDDETQMGGFDSRFLWRLKERISVAVHRENANIARKAHAWSLSRLLQMFSDVDLFREVICLV
jgi:hypothetical protein